MVRRGRRGSQTGPAPAISYAAVGAVNGGGTAEDLRFLSSRLLDARTDDLVISDQALAIGRWAPGTVDTWVGLLRGLSDTATKYLELNRSQTLAQHLQLLGAQGKKSVTLRGLVSGVRLCEKIGLITPTVCPIHWDMSAGPDRTYDHPAPAPVWGTPLMLAHMAAKVASEPDFITVGLAVISVCHLLRVGEVSSIRRSDISTVRRISFYRSKCANRGVTAPKGAWGEAWRGVGPLPLHRS